jgi:hypothetical protein
MNPARLKYHTRQARTGAGASKVRIFLNPKLTVPKRAVHRKNAHTPTPACSFCATVLKRHLKSPAKRHSLRPHQPEAMRPARRDGMQL